MVICVGLKGVAGYLSETLVAYGGGLRTGNALKDAIRLGGSTPFGEHTASGNTTIFEGVQEVIAVNKVGLKIQRRVRTDRDSAKQ